MAGSGTATYSTRDAVECFGTCYQTIAEAKLLEFVTSANATNIKKKDIDSELKRVIQLTQQIGFKFRDGMHATSIEEAEGIPVDR